MVAIKEVRQSNADLKSETSITTAVFVGATKGIGKSALIQLAKSVVAPRIYIVGRSLSSTTPLLDELKVINPQGTYNFLQGEISLIKDVDSICAEIKSKETSLNLLFLSAGTLSLAGRKETSEGLDTSLSVAYFERARFMYNLLPLLSKALSPRIVSVLGAGQEGKIDDLNDLELRNNYSMPKEATLTGTLMALSMNHLAKTYPHVSFVYTFPGLVDTDLLKRMFESTSGIWSVLGFLGRWILVPLSKFFVTSSEEAGERGLFAATSKLYAVSGSGGNYYRLDPANEPVKPNSVFEEYKKEGTDEVIWRKTVDIFDRITARG